VLVSLLVGVAVGAAAGFWRGWPAMVLLGLTDFALALPRVVLLLLLASLWQPSAGLVIVVLGLTGWMTIARLVHGEVRALAVRPFVEGAMGLGASDLRVLVRHILPNAMTPVIVAAALGLGNAIMLEAGLSFLGLGVQPPTPSWGGMIQEGREYLDTAWWISVFPGAILMLTSLVVSRTGDWLRDAFDPTLRGE
jgi:peptide/nickel transport system permease protein